MAIKVRFFASLREDTGLDHLEIAANDIAQQGITTATDVWMAATRGQPLPAQALCAINRDHAELGAAVNDGDEIAFFPPVTGG